MGGRYGSVPDDHDKSVTNLEYLTARAKRIPIYAFVLKEVLAVVPTWESNPDADFSRTVDTVKLFEFIRQVRTVDRVWTVPFETAQDIISALRQQLAYLASSGLELQRQLRGDQGDLKGLTGSAFRIALERRPGWQGRLFAQLIIDEIAASQDLRRAYDSNLNIGFGDRVSEDTAAAWLAACPEEANRLIGGLEHVANEQLNAALKTKDVGTIAYGARQIGRIYRETIEWAMRIRRAHLPEDWRPIAREMALMTNDLINQIEKLGPTAMEQIDQALAQPGDGPVVVTLGFSVSASNVERFNETLARFSRLRGIS
jgi:hypothetical protein